MKNQYKKSYKKYFFIAFLTSLAIFLLLISYINYVVLSSTKDRLYDNLNNIPAREVGLLLGTSKILPNNRYNLYYMYRIEATVKLYKAGKIKFIIVSGDNSSKNYNEPQTMKNDLINAGVPTNKIFADYAGFRTLDSVIRAKEIFGQKRITIISQPFHNERAIFIANYNGIDAIGFNATSVNGRVSYKTKIREKLARVKLMLDILVNKQPKFLGEKIKII